jgi:preprotein translocase subunit SecA
MELREVQVAAGEQLLGRCIAEMPTGEGKTLTTVIPAAVQASRHRGQGNVLVATANDYLAERDARWMEPIYRQLELRVGCVGSGSTPEQREQAYGCDVTYGTLRQFAFDFLRQSRRGAVDGGSSLPFRFDALIVDEADSLLIDEARTAMILTAPVRGLDAAREACYTWSARLAASLQIDADYVRLPDCGAIALTAQGRRLVIGSLMPAAMGSLTSTEILHAMERAIWVKETLHRDQHYLVRDGEIELVDEYTGRTAGQRSFGGGVHQAIEAREGVRLTPESQPVARISVQDFVAKFQHRCGLTATAWEDRRELRTVHGLSVQRFAPHRPSQRILLEPVICRSGEEKWQRIEAETRALMEGGRAVLIGTRTVEQSEQGSQRFRRCGIDHVVLNARDPRQEAEIIAQAGTPARVTIATNMAGRGTDIRLDPQVAAAGGLHVIVSELHAAARIDRQLIGRAARQGDPGTARLYACPDDEIVSQAFGSQRAGQIRQAASGGASRRWLWSIIRQSQTRVARMHRLERSRLTAQEASLAESMRLLGLDPHLDPLAESR